MQGLLKFSHEEINSYDETVKKLFIREFNTL